MPGFAGFHAPGMQFRAQQGGEVVAAKMPRVGDFVAESVHAVVGQGDEVVAVLAVAADVVFGRPFAIGLGGMPVDVAAVERAWMLEGEGVWGEGGECAHVKEALDISRFQLQFQYRN